MDRVYPQHDAKRPLNGSDMKKYPYIEPTIRTIAGGLVSASGLAVVFDPAMLNIALGVILFVGLNLFQSSFSQFCLMEKMLKSVGFRSEMDEIRSVVVLSIFTSPRVCRMPLTNAKFRCITSLSWTRKPLNRWGWRPWRVGVTETCG